MPASFLRRVPSSPAPPSPSPPPQAPLECPICLDPLHAKPTVRTACDHAFHETCLWDWVDTSARKGFVPLCPTCNADVTLDADDVARMTRATMTRSRQHRRGRHRRYDASSTVVHERRPSATRVRWWCCWF